MTDSSSLINIDGSHGEGGVQMLRPALALSMATGRPFRMSRIRAKQPKPGLMRQHLTCVQAAAENCWAVVRGDAIGSQEVCFVPGEVRPDAYRFSIGTAGSCTMVLQAILPPLLVANSASTITAEVGTPNIKAPPFEFFDRALVPLLVRAGAVVSARLERHGFYPAGGGRMAFEIGPASPRPLEILDRGQRTHARATAMVSRLPAGIATRELPVIGKRLGIEEGELHVIGVQDPIGPGNGVVAELGYTHLNEVFSAIGEISKSAELAAREACDEAQDCVAARWPVGPQLADQSVVPLTLLAGGRYACGPLTEHGTNNLSIVAKFGGNGTVHGHLDEVARLKRHEPREGSLGTATRPLTRGLVSGSRR